MNHTDDIISIIKLVESAAVAENFEPMDHHKNAPDTKGAKTTYAEPEDVHVLDMEPEASKGELSTSRANTSVANQDHPSMRVANTSTTRNATAGHTLSGDAVNAMRHLSNMVGDQEDIVSDEDAARNAGYDAGMNTDGYIEPTEPANPENLPAAISNAIRVKPEAGEYNVADVDPEWHQVKKLPGYISQQIRVIGRQVFTPFTNTPIEDIQVVAYADTPMGKIDINTGTEVKAMAAWISANGVKDDQASITAGENFDNAAAEMGAPPAYHADCQLWRTEHADFLIVVDGMHGREFGKYIYAWPGGRGSRLAGRSSAGAIEHK